MELSEREAKCMQGCESLSVCVLTRAHARYSCFCSSDLLTEVMHLSAIFIELSSGGAAIDAGRKSRL